jgi:hypothetical protein
MNNLKSILATFLMAAGATCHVAFGGETITITNVTAQVQGISGNGKPVCDVPALLSGRFSFVSKSAVNNFHGCCGVNFGFVSSILTNDMSPQEAYVGTYQLTTVGELCCSPSMLVSHPSFTGEKPCFEVKVTTPLCSEAGRPSSIPFNVYIRRTTNSTPIAKWKIKRQNPDVMLPPPSQEGWYVMEADGKSRDRIWAAKWRATF